MFPQTNRVEMEHFQRLLKADSVTYQSLPNTNGSSISAATNEDLPINQPRPPQCGEVSALHCLPHIQEYFISSQKQFKAT